MSIGLKSVFGLVTAEARSNKLQPGGPTILVSLDVWHLRRHGGTLLEPKVIHINILQLWLTLFLKKDARIIPLPIEHTQQRLFEEVT